MCLVFLAFRHVPGLPLVVAANRDEYYDRPTAALDFWEEAPHVLAGRDLTAGGTWMGLSRRGRFAALTNFRRPGPAHADAPSRGRLAADWLVDGGEMADYAARLRRQGGRFNGYNLIFGGIDRLMWHANVLGRLETVPPGLHGLSNGVLNEPWPKVRRGLEQLRTLAPRVDAWKPEALFELLADQGRPPDSELPDTGVGLDLERVLAPAFIRTETYGARCGTVILADESGGVYVEERRYDRDPRNFDPSVFRFRLDR